MIGRVTHIRFAGLLYECRKSEHAIAFGISLSPPMNVVPQWIVTFRFWRWEVSFWRKEPSAKRRLEVSE